jgi:hypothetical protein
MIDFKIPNCICDNVLLNTDNYDDLYTFNCKCQNIKILIIKDSYAIFSICNDEIKIVFINDAILVSSINYRLGYNISFSSNQEKVNYFIKYYNNLIFI